MRLMMLGSSKPIAIGGGDLWQAIEGEPEYRRFIEFDGAAGVGPKDPDDEVVEWLGDQLEPVYASAIARAHVVLAVAMDPIEGAEEEFGAWYGQEHLPALCRVPGVLGGARYSAVAGSPSHLALYYLEAPEACTSAEWMAAAVTPWTERMRPRAENRLRGLYIRAAEA